MAVISYSEISMHDIEAEGVKDVVKANVIGEKEGWDHHTLRLFRVQPGGYTSRHRHDWEHVNYIVKGTGRLRVGNDVRPLKESDFVFIPPNVEHQFQNAGASDFEFIDIVTSRAAY